MSSNTFRVFELSATLPNDQTLTVSVKDRDRLSLADDLIGETSIDIENRYLTQYRAICGLPSTFSMYVDACMHVQLNDP